MPDVASQVLEIAIALAFVYFLLSLITSGIAEVIAVSLRLRARTLETGLRELLGSEKADQLFEHSLVSKMAKGERKTPSYLSARNFAFALIDTVAPPPEGTPGSRNVLNAVAESVATLPSPLKQQLSPLVEDAQGDLTRFRASVEDWFDDSMLRVSGWYKRRSQVIVFILAALVTVGLNVDTLRITDRLWDDGALRESVVGAAIETVQAEQATGGGAPSGDEAVASDAGGVGAATDEPGADAGASFGDVGAALDETKASLDTFEGLQLPVGWNEANDDWLNLQTLTGWLVTFFAVSLGAPFWFDALSRLARLRGTGPVPETSTQPRSSR